MTEAYNELPETINPNNFPAKLWRMVNNPDNSAICWDATGEKVVIDQQLFQELVLSPVCKNDEGNSDSFKTTHFSSFVRQLNLYGFRKTEVLSSLVSFDSYIFKSPERQNNIHHFFNPNFRRDNPALLIHLKRLTVENKAKMVHGIDVKCRPPNKSLRDCSEDEEFLMKGRARKMSPPRDYNIKKEMTPYNGTPVPPRHGAQRQDVPSIGCPTPAVLSTPLQQGVRFGINYGAPNFTGIQPQNELYLPGFYASAYQCIPLMAAVNGMNGPFPTIGYYSAPYPRSLLDSQNRMKEEKHKTDVNLDRVFQMADEEMLPQPNNTLIKIASPEMQSSSAAEGDHQRNALQKNTVDSGPSAVSAFKTEESVEQTPGEATEEDPKKHLIKDEATQAEVSTSGTRFCQI